MEGKAVPIQLFPRSDREKSADWLTWVILTVKQEIWTDGAQKTNSFAHFVQSFIQALKMLEISIQFNILIPLSPKKQLSS